MTQGTVTLRSQILTSAKLSTLRFACRILLRIVSVVVLSRLLSPEDYGVFAIVLAYTFLLEMFSDLGLRSLVITREREVTDGFLCTVWAVSVLRGVVILGLSALLGWGIAMLQSRDVFAAGSTYAATELPWVLTMVGLATLIFGLETPMRFASERQMAFGRMTLSDIIRDIATLVVTVALAYQLRSVWALAYGQILRSILHIAMGYAMFGIPKGYPRLEQGELYRLFERGKWILTHSSLTALSQYCDRFLLGFAMNSATFGFYYIARQFADLLPQFLVAVNGQMGVQVFSRLRQKSHAEFQRDYYRYRLVFDALAGVSAGGIVILAPLIVEIVFDDRYRPVAPFMQILALGGLLFGPQILQSVFNAERNFRITALSNGVATILLWVALGVAVFVIGSIPVAVFIVALYKLPEVLVLMWAGRRRGWVSLRRESMVMAFFTLGAGLGWVVLRLWEYLT